MGGPWVACVVGFMGGRKRGESFGVRQVRTWAREGVASVVGDQRVAAAGRGLSG